MSSSIDRTWSPDFVVEHAMSHIGLEADAGRLLLRLSDDAVDDDGWVDIGVLGVYCDIGCTQLATSAAFLHVDISISQVARPRGDTLRIDSRLVREGTRSAVARLTVLDDRDTVVAESSQHLSIRPADMGEFRTQVYRHFGTPRRLDRRFDELIGLRRDADGPRLDLTPMTRNIFAGLHGGTALGFVAHAAGPPARAVTCRYLRPALVGPFRADVSGRGDHQIVDVYDEGADAAHVITADVIRRA